MAARTSARCSSRRQTSAGGSDIFLIPWLAGTLLVPDEAAILIARRQLNIAEAAAVYVVSDHMMKFRLNVTTYVRVTSAARYLR